MTEAWAKQKRSGFTIVELLIVIVILSILVAMSVAAYSGMQTRARNTARIVGVAEYIKILKAYAATYGKYPMTGIEDWGCLGEDYPDFDSDGQGDCADVIGGANRFHPSSAVNAEIRKVVTTLPSFDKQPVKFADGVSRMGIFTDGSPKKLDGKDFYYTIGYYLEGQGQNCSNSNTLEYNGGWPNFKISTTGYTTTDSKGTYCAIYLPAA